MNTTYKQVAIENNFDETVTFAKYLLVSLGYFDVLPPLSF